MCPVSAVQVLGTVAGGLTGAGPLPQIVKLAREREADDIAWWYLAVSVEGAAWWVGYGARSGLLPQIAANAAWLVGLLVLCVQKGSFDGVRTRGAVAAASFAGLGLVALAVALSCGMAAQPIGYVAGVVTGLGPIPQLIKTARRRRAKQLSARTVAAVVLETGCWIAYGALVRGFAVIAGNAVVCAEMSMLAVQMRVYSRAGRVMER